MKTYAFTVFIALKAKAFSLISIVQDVRHNQISNEYTVHKSDFENQAPCID